MNVSTIDGSSLNSRTETFRRFRMNGLLTAFKLKKYLPAMFLTNLSTFLLTTVDGLVVGNMIGPGALSSVNIFYPATVFIGVLGILSAVGISTCLSLHMGRHDAADLPVIKATGMRFMILAAIAAGIIQIPIIHMMIASYHLSPSMQSMTRQYALGIMISAPFGLISTVGVYELQIIGKMKRIMTLSVVEGVTNLLLDILFIGPMKMGVAGAGYGTACATILRCALTVILLSKDSGIYRSGQARPSAKYGKEMLNLGLSDAAYMLMQAFQNYFIVMIILRFLGEEGGAIKGVCAFTLSLAFIVINGVQGAMRPLAGLLSGAKEWEGLYILMRQCLVLIGSLLGVYSLFVLSFPQVFYFANGVRAIPDGGLTALRLFALHFVLKGCNALLRTFSVTRKPTRILSVLTTVAGYATLPAFAFLIGLSGQREWLWSAYLLTELVIFALNAVRYLSRKKQDEQEKIEDRGILYLSVTPDEAAEASRLLRRYAEANGINRRQSYRLSLCLEEMAAYSEQSQKNRSLLMQIMIRFRPDTAMLMMIDNGRCIALDHDPITQDLVISNYDLIKKVAKNVRYQYIQDMNYTVIEI